MRNLLHLIAAIIGLSLTVPAAPTVVPATPEQIIMMKKRQALEDRARRAFGDIGLIEKLRDWRTTWGFILVGEEGSSNDPRLIVKDEYGWYEMRQGKSRRLPAGLTIEINRLLHRPELWVEDAYNFGSACKRTPRLFVIMHAGQDKFGRLDCGPEGLAARVAQTAGALRVLPGKVQSTAPPQQQRSNPPGASPAYFDATNQISAHLFGMAAAWERKTLAGFVEPYAPDAILEGPTGVYRGRRTVVNWARQLQDWKSPYSAGDKRLRVERIVSKNQDARHIFYTTHELRWDEAGKPVRQTFSTMWRNHGGLWLIAHAKMSDVKPVTAERVDW